MVMIYNVYLEAFYIQHCKARSLMRGAPLTQIVFPHTTLQVSL